MYIFTCLRPHSLHSLGLPLNPPRRSSPVDRHSLQNWTHFVYKLDNLFRSIRVSDENSSVTRALHFFKTYLNSRLFLSQHYAAFKATPSISNTF